MEGYFCLKWNNHSPSFLQNLRSIQEKKLYCDVTIACDGKFYPVHKLVLASCSDYFREIFARAECKHPFLILKDIQPSELEALLDYMYKGEVNVLQEAISGLIQAAKTLKIKGLAIPDVDSESKEENTSTENSSVKCDRKRSLSPIASPSSQYSKEKEHEGKKTKLEEQTRNKADMSLDSIEEEKANVKVEANHDYEDNGASISISSNEEECFPQSIKNEDTLPNDSKTDKLDEDEDSFDDNSVNFFNAPPVSQAQKIFSNLLFSDNQHSIFKSDSDGTSLGSTNPLLNLAQCSSWDTNNDGGRPNDISLDEILRGRQTNELVTKSLLGSPNFLASLTASDEPLQCELCHYKCKKDLSMRKHMLRKHSDNSAGISVDKSMEEENGKIQNYLKCCYCTYTTVQPSRLKSHMSIHTGYKPYNCTYCQYKSSQSGTMKRHIQKVHKDKFSF